MFPDPLGIPGVTADSVAGIRTEGADEPVDALSAIRPASERFATGGEPTHDRLDAIGNFRHELRQQLLTIRLAWDPRPMC